MSAYWGTEDHVTDAINTANMTSAAATFKPGKPADVKRIIVVVTTANTAAATGTVAVAGTTVGTFVIPITADAGTVYAVDVAGAFDTEAGVSQSSATTTGTDDTVQLSTPGVVEVDVGEAITVTWSGGTTGVADVHFEYVEQGNNPERYNPTKVTYTPA